MLRPVALVVFKNQEVEAPQWAYVDSGADMTLIPKSMGDLLGFTFNDDKKTEVKGIGSNIPVVMKRITVQIGEKEIETTVAWSLVEEVPTLLGRKDIFDNFEITFKNNKTTFKN